MSASTKLRITTNQRKVLRLEAQQTAYRSIIDRFNGFRDKYFDVLNSATNLRSRATFNRHAAKITRNGAEVKPAGVNVTVGANATPGNYKVTVESLATQTKVTSAAMDKLAQPIDLSDFEDGKSYAMSVTVGGTQRWISFKGDHDADEVVKNINEALQVFGRTNDTAATGKGRVFFNDDISAGPIGFTATDRSAISTSAVTELKTDVNLGLLANMETGNNSITLVIDGQSKVVNFQTVKEDYFSDLSFVQNADGIWSVVGGTAESRAAFNAIVQEMYDKQRNDSFETWAAANPAQNRVMLNAAQTITALNNAGINTAGLTSSSTAAEIETFIDNLSSGAATSARNAINNATAAEALNIRATALQSWATANSIDTTGVNWTNANSVNAFINANTGARAAADTATFNHIYNNQMNAQQRAMFDEEVERRNVQTRQTEFDRAITALYNEFDAWQRKAIGGSLVDNPDFNPLMPPSAANSPTINNPNYLFRNDWLAMMGLDNVNVEALYTAHGDEWAQGILSNVTFTDIPFLTALQDGTGIFASMTQTRREELLDELEEYMKADGRAQKRFEQAAETAYNGKIYNEHRLTFLQIGYNERNAYYNSFDGGAAVPGSDFNTFFRENVVGISGAAADFTPAQKAAALVAAGFAGAAGLTTDAQIDAFLASSAMNASDASRLHVAQLAQRTAVVDAGNGTTTHNGLTTYERIAVLQAQGINVSGIADATSHASITSFIGTLAAEDQTKVNNALTAARNSKIQAVTLTPAQQIAALNSAGINTGSIVDPTDTEEINKFITDNVTAVTDRQKANNAINAAQVAHFNAIPKTPNPAMTPEALARYFNDNVIDNTLNKIVFDDGTKVEAVVDGSGNLVLEAYREDADGNRITGSVLMGAIINAGSKNDFSVPGGNEFPTQENTVSSISTSTRLSELGLEAVNGNYTFTINDVLFTFGANTTVREMMTAVNNNTRANVEMSFSTLTNNFEIKSKEFGADGKLEIGSGTQGDAQGLLAALGFGTVGGVEQFTRTEGKNLSLTIDDGKTTQTIETASDTFTMNGITIRVGPNAVEGPDGTFEISVERDTSALLDIIKDFVKDYNAMIDYVFGYVNEKPDREYFMLTDTDREELGMTDRQEQKWEERAMKGLLYNDRTLTKLMSDMRIAMFSGIDRGDGTMFGLFSMGITTSTNWRDNGKLVIDEQKLTEAIENNIELITELFTSTAENPKTKGPSGIMPQLHNVINSATRTTGERWERGLLVQRAGMANQTSATSNAIYDQIKRLNSVIANLELRYQRQQDRYWKIFSALETQMGQLNSQSDFVAQMGMNNLWGMNNR
jgi:flagellar capping protein FliD